VLRSQRGDWLLNYRELAETITQQVPLPNLCDDVTFFGIQL
jgi:hypothetical protein